MNADSFGDRMKRYEAASDFRLPVRLPVLLRLDGNSFSRFTSGAKLEKPYDRRFERAMDAAAEATLAFTHGMVAYIQSDEITILLRNDRSHQDEPLLGNRIQKICSLAASTCAVAFDRALRAEAVEAINAPAFDCRAYVLPHSDVNNAFLWRQRDAFKNCVGSVAFYKLGGAGAATKRLTGVSTDRRQELLFSEFGVNVNDLPTRWKRGRCIRRENYQAPITDTIPPDRLAALVSAGRVDPTAIVTRSRWAVDEEIPEFNVDPNYIGHFLDNVDIVSERRPSSEAP